MPAELPLFQGIRSWGVMQLPRNGRSESDQMAVREQLGRILQSSPFLHARRRQRFLEYIVNETLAGRGERLKGYSIAQEVFDRSDAFDPNVDPIVRVEAARVRDKLREYYEADGRNDPIRIDLPKGSYTPQIEFRETAPTEPLLAHGTPSDARTDATGSPTAMTSIDAKPSIAVLPFVNMSAKRADDYLSDAITENIITALSRFRDLAVVASHSVFSYKGKGGRIPEIARELGVRFVLEGSVQKSKERVTITAQLIDGGTGAHLWAERFDRAYGDLLAVLDEVTEHIVGRLGSPYTGRVGKAWRGLAGGGTPRKLQAYDHLLAGLDIFDDYVPGCMAKARACFFKAIELDPTFGKAYAKVAFSHILDAWLGWSADVAHSVAEAQKYATLAITRDDDESWGHWAVGSYSIFVGQHERAIAAYRRALQLNPNDPDLMADFGACLTWAGRSQEAVEIVHKAMQINPHYPEWWLMNVGQIYFDARRYEEAVSALESVQELNAVANCLYLGASHAALGNLDRARAAIARAREIDARLSVSSITRGYLNPYKEAVAREHLRLNLIKAGLPE
jgi:adenylate cyclase